MFYKSTIASNRKVREEKPAKGAKKSRLRRRTGGGRSRGSSTRRTAEGSCPHIRIGESKITVLANCLELADSRTETL